MRFISLNRITSGGAKRRGLAALTVAVAVVAIAGCGGGGGASATGGAPASTDATSQDVSTPTPAFAQSPDGELLNKVLSRQEGVVAAYKEVTPHLAPRFDRMASYFRAQEEEHVDAVVKALRGIKAPDEAEPEAIEPGERNDEREWLVFLYEVDAATIDEELSAISKFEAAWPRSLLASTVADQAQHLTLLRQALGAGPLASTPAPFEDGTAPPPE